MDCCLTRPDFTELLLQMFYWAWLLILMKKPSKLVQEDNIIGTF